MHIGERIKLLRKELKLTQKEFGERISIKQNSVAQIEMGRNTSPQTITAICRAFGVSEQWLRYGIGEMFESKPKSELEALIAKYPNVTRETIVFVEKFISLPIKEQDAVIDFMKEVIANLEEEPKKAEESGKFEEQPKTQNTDTAAEIMEIKRQNADLYRRIEAIEKESETIGICHSLYSFSGTENKK